MLRHLIVRTTRDEREAVAMLVVTRNDKRLRKPIRDFLDGPDRPTGFFLNIHERPGPYMVGKETIRLDGRSHVRERIADTSFLISPTAFFQTNAAVAATLVDLVLEAAPATPRLQIADLYSGSGLFALPLATRGHVVTAVEENAQAVKDGETNVTLNRLDDRVRFIKARVEDALARVARAGADLVVLDPPRQGCPPAVAARLFGRLAPADVIYVSCNAEALASELPAILEHGYIIHRVQPVDMFPHTAHVETVVRLRRGARYS